MYVFLQKVGFADGVAHIGTKSRKHKRTDPDFDSSLVILCRILKTVCHYVNKVELI